MYSFISKETTHLNEGKTVQVTTEHFFFKNYAWSTHAHTLLRIGTSSSISWAGC